MIWGVVIGTYSTIYIATPVLYYLNLRTAAREGAGRRPSSRRAEPAAMESSTPQVCAGPAGRAGLPAGRLHRRRASRQPARCWCLPDRVLPWAGDGAGRDRPWPASQAICGRPSPVPDILVVGMGAGLRCRSRPTLRQAIRAWGPVVEAMATPAACRTYNVLLAEGRRVAAALIALPACLSALRRCRRCCGSGRPRAAAPPAGQSRLTCWRC